MVVYGDGVRDDTEALQKFLDGKADLIFEDGTPFKGYRNCIDETFGQPGKTFKISKTLNLA